MHFVCILLISLPLVLVLNFTYRVLWVPFKIQAHFRRQGINGPDYRPIYGNSPEISRLFEEARSKKPMSFRHDILVARVIPFYHEWSPMYGKNFLFWYGIRPALAVSDPDMIREVLMNTSNGGPIEKGLLHPLSKLVFGEGLAVLEGEKWALHRRIINKAFYVDRVKGWVPEIVSSTRKMIEKWEEIGGGRDEFEIEMHEQLHHLSAQLITRAIFGSSENGNTIFQLQKRQMILVSPSLKSAHIPGFRYLPTKNNREWWGLEKEMRETISNLMKPNDKTSVDSTNLLSVLMSSYKNKDGEEETMSVDDVIDECKTFLFGGKETTGNVLTWALVLLAFYQEWQIKARQEVLSVCGKNRVLVAEHLNDLKIVGMILNETLRLYPTAMMLLRKITKKTKLGKLDIPAGTEFSLPLLAVHHDKDIWGEDAHEFNPTRFNESSPRKLGSYFPFGLGPRTCIGQNFAIVEAKVALAMIIRSYSFVLSPTYIHAPFLFVSLQPQFGAQIVLRKI